MIKAHFKRSIFQSLQNYDILKAKWASLGSEFQNLGPNTKKALSRVVIIIIIIISSHST